MPTLLSSLLPMILGSPVLLRASSKDPVTAPLLARALTERDDVLARAFECVSFPHDDAEALASWLEAPCVVATGSDETLAALATAATARGTGTRFVGYGHRFSIGVVGPDLEHEGGALEEAIEGFAVDIARWDQLGCLSPAVLYLVDVPRPRAEVFARRLAETLETVAERMPRGAVPAEARALQANERGEARMRSGPDGALLHESESACVILEVDARSRPAPLHRFIRLHPVPSVETLQDVLEPFAPHLSTAAVTGFSKDSHAALERLLTRLGISRVSRPGCLQTPPVDWPHDGFPLLTPMARFTQHR